MSSSNNTESNSDDKSSSNSSESDSNNSIESDNNSNISSNNSKSSNKSINNTDKFHKSKLVLANETTFNINNDSSIRKKEDLNFQYGYSFGVNNSNNSKKNLSISKKTKIKQNPFTLIKQVNNDLDTISFDFNKMIKNSIYNKSKLKVNFNINNIKEKENSVNSNMYNINNNSNIYNNKHEFNNQACTDIYKQSLHNEKDQITNQNLCNRCKILSPKYDNKNIHKNKNTDLANFNNNRKNQYTLDKDKKYSYTTIKDLYTINNTNKSRSKSPVILSSNNNSKNNFYKNSNISKYSNIKANKNIDNKTNFNLQKEYNNYMSQRNTVNNNDCLSVYNNNSKFIKLILL